MPRRHSRLAASRSRTPTTVREPADALTAPNSGRENVAGEKRPPSRSAGPSGARASDHAATSTTIQRPRPGAAAMKRKNSAAASDPAARHAVTRNIATLASLCDGGSGRTLNSVS